MNLSRRLNRLSNLIYRLCLKSRSLLPRQKCHVFGPSVANHKLRIEKIYVINLDRKMDRWIDVTRELHRIIDSLGVEIARRSQRFSAIDANSFNQEELESEEVSPFYTLSDQLFVEPQPRALPDSFELERPILMSPAEIAVAHSHVNVWRKIAESEHPYALVLEDDVWFDRGFARIVDRAWAEMVAKEGENPKFDFLYLSYKEVTHGAPKEFLSASVFRPERGLWYLSGYVLSQNGARKLLNLLPCRGPIDLWINHQFGVIDVRAVSRSIIHQRRDLDSTNSYSILPSLTKIGVIDSEGAALFPHSPKERPVFAFGTAGSGLSSLAMALSMLGYRCCSDLEDLPQSEYRQLLMRGQRRLFNAYVNIGSLSTRVGILKGLYPDAKFIITESAFETSIGDALAFLEDLEGCDVTLLSSHEENKWKVVCEHLKCAPPACSFPELRDVGQQWFLDEELKSGLMESRMNLKRDRSPWIVDSDLEWKGIRSIPVEEVPSTVGRRVSFNDYLEVFDANRWMVRKDTFSGNLALFRLSNVDLHPDIGVTLTVKKESLGVRDFSAAAISSRDRFLYGRFEATLQATRVPGLVTGFFLHRDSPRQEIDIEIVGNRPDRLLVNVFYNPGGEGAKFDYGYRGAPTSIALGFDASESAHRFAIEWDPNEIRWLVDGQLVHKRVNWDPTPIPHLPMTLHVNTWPSRSKELAGRVACRKLPAVATVGSIFVDAHVVDDLTSKLDLIDQHISYPNSEEMA